ncbi:MAG: hypothetical protein AB4041_08125 [Microcystaceae cyanobacterium]
MNQNDDTVLICSVHPTLPCLIDKGIDTIALNPQAVTIISYGIAIAVVLIGLGRGISEIVAKLKS